MTQALNEAYDEPSEYDEYDEVEDFLNNCGKLPDGTCTMAGTEYCDFSCKFRDE